MSNPFQSLACMLQDGSISQVQSNQISLTLKSLPDDSNSLLKLIAASLITGIADSADDVSPIKYKSSTYTAVAGDRIMADTSAGAFTITLPISPQVGDTVEIFDAQSSFATNNLTIARNGKLIDSNAGNLIADIDNVHFTMYFNGGAIGWAVYQG